MFVDLAIELLICTPTVVLFWNASNALIIKLSSNLTLQSLHGDSQIFKVLETYRWYADDLLMSGRDDGWHVCAKFVPSSTVVQSVWSTNHSLTFDSREFISVLSYNVSYRSYNAGLHIFTLGFSWIDIYWGFGTRKNGRQDFKDLRLSWDFPDCK